MKPAAIFAVPLALAVCAGLLGGCSKGDPDEAAKAPEKAAAETAPGVTLDAATQARIGLSLGTPAPAQWQPVLHATGLVADPLAFLSAAADFEGARTAAAASRAELVRTQKLAAQENASPRVLEAAQAAADRDRLALQAARAKFAGDWGRRLASQTNLAAIGEKLQAGGLSFTRIFLPAGSLPDPLPTSATLHPLGQETNAVAAEFADNLNVDPGTQVQTLLFSSSQKLPPDLSVTAELKTAGEPLSGVVVPAAAVLRHEGKGWVYVQRGTNQFVRAEVPLNRWQDGGWFVAEGFPATNRIVVTGAQTVLSAELSGSGFNTGQRD